MIYLDVLFVFNFIIDHLILILVREKYFPQMKKRRIAGGSCLAATTYIVWFCLLGNASVMLRAATAGVLISFTLIWTYRITTWRLFKKTVCATTLYLFLLGGLGTVLEKILYGIPFFEGIVKKKKPGVFLLGMIVFTVFFMIKGRRDKKNEQREESIYEVQIIRKNRSIFLQGLYDSGNLLVSEMTGTGICVLSYKEANKIMDEREKVTIASLIRQKDFSWKVMEENLQSGIYQINYSSVGKEDGWMPGILADHIIVKKEGEILTDRSGMMGIAVQKISRNERFDVLLPADIFAKADHDSK